MNLGENCRAARRVPICSTSRSASQDAESLTRVVYDSLAEDEARECKVHGSALLADAKIMRRGLEAHDRRRGRASRAFAPRTIATASSRTSSFAASATCHRRARSRWRSSASRTRTAASSGSIRGRRVRPPREAPQGRRSSSCATTTINVTIHAGEAYGPESIHQAIHQCGAHRIGHGCRLREDGDLHYVNDHRISLECCPSSNVQTGAIRDLASHPIKLYKTSASASP